MSFFGLKIGGNKEDAPVIEEKPKHQVTINTVEEAANYLKKIKDDADHNRIDREMFPMGEAEEGITTCTDQERREYLNYAINLMPDSLIKYKIILFLRCNPYWEDGQGNQKFLSKKGIANMLTKECGFKILDVQVDAEEKQAIVLCMENLKKMRLEDVPLVGINRF